MKALKAAPDMDDREIIFSNIPPEIILNILLRVPIETVLTCKCVCKSWLELLESPEFVRSHLSNSAPGLLIYRFDDRNRPVTSAFKIFGFEDSHEIERHELRYRRVIQLKSENTFGDGDLRIIQIEGSANGLLFFRDSFPKPDDYYICNPITHECLKLPKRPVRIPMRSIIFTHGFGVSRLSNRYKVVMILNGLGQRDPDTGLLIEETVCQVYTLGTRSWRSVTAPRENLIDFSTGKLLNGNLHWLTLDSTRTLWISRFDIETEVFTKFRAPPLELERDPLTEVGVLRDRLSVSEFSSMSEIVVYLMTDDGCEKESWSKEYVIGNIQVIYIRSIDAICPLKAFGDGVLLLAVDHDCFLCYSDRTKTIAPVDILNEVVEGYSQTILYTPSFISLKDFETENAKMFEFACSVIG